MDEREDSERGAVVGEIAAGAPNVGEQEEAASGLDAKHGSAGSAAAEEGPGTLRAKILMLKKEQADLKRARKQGQKELRNLERKRKRLSQKAKLLSDEDLLQVLSLRREAKAMNKSSGPSAGEADAKKD
jgi:hypothetical protein